MEDLREGKHTEFEVIENGPLHVIGNFSLKGPDGSELQVDREAWLCRCGESANKPFCDGSHRKAGFRG